MLELPEFYEGLKAFELVWAERLRQKEVECHTPAHDDEHEDGELALLAAAYALSGRPDIGPDPALSYLRGILEEWGWSFKPKDPIRDLTRAGALILAELERRLRNQDPVSRAIAEGKLQEGQRGWAQNLLDRDPEGFQKYIGDVGSLPTLLRWQSHKIVEADKIVGDQTDLEGYPADGSCWLLACGVVIPNPPLSRVLEGVSAIGGYFVRYEDGFESWSPAEAFEKGYNRVEP